MAYISVVEVFWVVLDKTIVLQRKSLSVEEWSDSLSSELKDGFALIYILETVSGSKRCDSEIRLSTLIQLDQTYPICGIRC